MILRTKLFQLIPGLSFLSILFICYSCKPAEVSQFDQNPSSGHRFDLKKDFSFTEKKKVEMILLSESQQGKYETKQIFEYSTNKKMIQFSSNGSFQFERVPVRFFVEQLTLSGENPHHGNFRYDSAISPDTEIPQHLWTQAKEVGEKLILEISSDGKLKSLKDSSQFKKNMIEKGKILFGDENFSNPIFLNQVEDYYTESAIEGRILYELEVFVSSTDSIGKTWKTENHVMGNISQLSKYEYISDENGLAKVEIEVIQGLKKSIKESRENSEHSHFGYTKAEGKTLGTVWVIKGTGWIHHGSISQNLSYEMEINDPATGKLEKYKTSYRNKTDYSF